MADIGLDFKPPPRHETEAWAVAEQLYRHGFNYHGCGCGGVGFRPTRWADVPEFLSKHRCMTEGEKLLARYTARGG